MMRSLSLTGSIFCFALFLISRRMNPVCISFTVEAFVCNRGHLDLFLRYPTMLDAPKPKAASVQNTIFPSLRILPFSWPINLLKRTPLTGFLKAVKFYSSIRTIPMKMNKKTSSHGSEEQDARVLHAPFPSLMQEEPPSLPSLTVPPWAKGTVHLDPAWSRRAVPVTVSF